MIDQEHFDAMKRNCESLTKKNTLLEAREKIMIDTIREIVDSGAKALRDMASMYDTANKNLMLHLIDNKVIEENGELHYNLLNIMPMKLGK